MELDELNKLNALCATNNVKMVEVPSNIIKEIQDALNQFSNVLYDGMFSVDKLPVPKDIKVGFIKKRGDIEALNERLTEHACYHDADSLALALSEINDKKERMTVQRLKRFNKLNHKH